MFLNSQFVGRLEDFINNPFFGNKFTLRDLLCFVDVARGVIGILPAYEAMLKFILLCIIEGITAIIPNCMFVAIH
jgi:hypothetical protein